MTTTYKCNVTNANEIKAFGKWKATATNTAEGNMARKIDAGVEIVEVDKRFIAKFFL